MSEKNKTIQQKLDDLNQLVLWFQGDEFTLEESLEKFKSAEALAEEIDSDLDNLKNEINVLKKRFDIAED